MTYHQLTQEERYRISAHRMAGVNQAEIARLLRRSPGTISRELRRNATTHDRRYRPSKAHRYALARRRRCRSTASWRRWTARIRRRLRCRWQRRWRPSSTGRWC